MMSFTRNSKEIRKKKTGKAILGLMLCLTLMVGMLSGISLTAKADGIVAELWSPDAQTKIAEYETLQAAFSAAETAGVYAGIKLMQDVTVSESLTLNQDINLFLNGHTLTVNEGGAITTGVTNFTPNIDVWSGTSEGAGGSIVISGKVSAYMNVGSGDVSVSVNGGETQHIMMYDGTINITGGTIQHVQTWGTANVSGGTIGVFGPENGVSTIIGGTIEHVDMLNNDGSPTLDIRGNVNITDELILEYYGGDEYSGIATVTVSGTPQIARIGFQYAFFGEGEDTGEGNWGSLTITGGYFGNNPNTVFALNDIQAGHIAVAIDEIEEYSNQANWAADSAAYKFRVVPQAAASAGMYRLYNPNSGEHFYTASEEEKDTLLGYGWNWEGIAWNAPVLSNTPVYRLYNPNAGDHHYTTSGEEKEMLVEAGWNYEGVGWYSDDAYGVPLYRLYNPNAWTGTHHYTTSEEEKENLIVAGWLYEGISWHGTK